MCRVPVLHSLVSSSRIGEMKLLHQQKENLGTPQSTSSPAAPIKVRVSARKLREIRSPYLSGDGSFCESIPRALTPTDAGVISKEAATTCK